MGAFVDLSGKRFGRWLAIERGLNDGSNFVRYLCKCDCGTVRLVHGASLRKGTSKSCGCLLREVAAKTRLNDLTGRRFGRLVVLRRAENSIRGCARWVVSCDCGTEKIVGSGSLVTGETASCGCARKSRSVVRTEEARARTRARANNRYRKDPAFNLKARMANSIRSSLLKKGKTRKTNRWQDLVGYTVDQLKDRLVSTLPPGYTWDDYMNGTLHIDHIVPLCAFNYERDTDIDFRRAWALSNLRLLPSEENLTKSGMLDTPFQPSLCF